MFFSNGMEPLHLQGAFVSTQEVERIAAFIGGQRGYPTAMLLRGYAGGDDVSNHKAFDPDSRDPFFEEAARLIVMHQQGATSLIQRKLKLGYNRAGRIIDQLEAAGIVGPFEGEKAREVLYPDKYALERYLEELAAKRKGTLAAEPAPPLAPVQESVKAVEQLSLAETAPEVPVKPQQEARGKRKGLFAGIFNFFKG